MARRRTTTKQDLLEQVERLRGKNQELTAEITQLRCEDRNATIIDLQEQVAALTEELRLEREENASYKREAAEHSERIEQLEALTDADAISEEVHQFYRSEHLVPESLDAPLFLAPHVYRIGLYEAIQKVVTQ